VYSCFSDELIDGHGAQFTRYGPMYALHSGGTKRPQLDAELPLANRRFSDVSGPHYAGVRNSLNAPERRV
jgi:hypothetical protein